jgi:hypothetical protein
MAQLRILRTPTGAAPDHVRRAWVGLELPLIKEGEFVVQSVLEQAMPRTWLEWLWARLTGRLQRAPGFAVFTLDALAVLEATRPLEAAWWKANAAHLFVPGAFFVFDARCGEVTE